LQFLVRLPLLQVFGSEKTGEMLSDDLGLRIAEDALGPGVPGADLSVRIEEEDGIVGQALHQQAVLFFGSAQGRRKRLVFGRLVRWAVWTALVHGSSPSTVATCRASFSRRLRTAVVI